MNNSIMTQEEKDVLARNQQYGTSYDETNWIDNVDWWNISYQSLSEPFIEKHAERLDWYNISRHQSLSEPFMEKHAERLYWWHISVNQTLSEPFMEKHAERLDWGNISAHQSLSEPFMEKHAERLDWWNISCYQSLSEPFIEKFAERLDWGSISVNQTLSEPFMEKHAEHLDWWSISRYQFLSERFMEKHAERLDWGRISRYQFLSERFMEKHAERLPKGFRDNNWLYADRAEKLRHIREKAPEFVVQEDEGGPFIVAWKSARPGGRSQFKPGIRYEVGGRYEAHCDCLMDQENSFGLSAWTEKGAKEFIRNGELYRVKIYVDDIGAMVHDGKKIRCRKQEFLERV